MNRIHAFTLVELIVTLLIGSIITGIIYYSYLLFNKQFIKYRENSEWINEFIVLQKALQQDIDAASRVRDSAGRNLILENYARDRIIYYEFKDSSVLRRTALNESRFVINTGTVNFIYINDSIRLVKALLVECKKGTDKTGAVFNKNYSSAQIINYQNEIE